MLFQSTTLPGVFVLELERIADERGFFARTFSKDEFRERGLTSRLAQCSLSFNPLRGTLRGLHYQAEPYAETRLVRCTMGAIYDVVVDLRPDSDAYCRWVAAELSADNRLMLYVPEGCAHGYLTLTNDAEVFYQMSEAYRPEAARGVRWDDPAFSVSWPFSPRLMSDRDAAYEAYSP
jgi:dTDP-4-dehydrorhamnose 3,5-epimerase